MNPKLLQFLRLIACIPAAILAAVAVQIIAWSILGVTLQMGFTGDVFSTDTGDLNLRGLIARAAFSNFMAGFALMGAAVKIAPPQTPRVIQAAFLLGMLMGALTIFLAIRESRWDNLVGAVFFMFALKSCFGPTKKAQADESADV